ncbi:hypothetical protein [Pelagimonas sp.]|uniref:hypothetical protein n=1 Tax=Pelagimonas sp. TaxID=2073170 RepID=UPI003D6B1E93
MANLKNTSVFRAQRPKLETAMDKTTRVARKMIEEEEEQRKAKIDYLRNARLERDTITPTKP